jgi:hypothetical protein
MNKLKKKKGAKTPTQFFFHYFTHTPSNHIFTDDSN